MLFSVIIPCYNHAHFLDEALSSLSEQNYLDWEAIIVNDGSTDDTVEVADLWCKKDARIKLISRSNHGLSASRNTGIEFSNGKYIALLDADDKFAPDHLQNLLGLLEDGNDIVFTGYTYFTMDTPSCHPVFLRKHLPFDQILFGNLVPPVAVAFRKSCIRYTGGFDTALKSAEDWDLWIRFFKVGAQLAIHEKPTAFYRISDKSMSRQFMVMYDALKKVFLNAHQPDQRISKEYILNKVYPSYPLEPLKRYLLMCLGVAVLQNNIPVALELFKKETDLFDFRYQPKDFKSMCSHLSFRYNVSRTDLQWVFNSLYPQFTEFFDKLNLDGLNTKEALTDIFSMHKKKLIKMKWGILSPLINRIS